MMNNHTDIKNTVAVLTLSDPWELGESINWKPINGIIIKHGIRHESIYGKEGESLIFKLDEPITHKEVRYEYVVASPRHKGDSFSELTIGKDVFCSLVRIPSEQVDSETPFDLTWWRGGGALIGTLSSKKKENGKENGQQGITVPV